MVARHVIEQVLARLGPKDKVRFGPKCAYVLARLSSRLIRRATESPVAEALSGQSLCVTEEDCWRLMGEREGPRLH